MKLMKWMVGAPLLAAVFVIGPASSALASDKYLGEVFWTSAASCPTDSVQAAGQIWPIGSNAALFTILGSAYGGNKKNTFALPDLRAAVPLGRRDALSGSAKVKPVAPIDVGQKYPAAACAAGQRCVQDMQNYMALQACIVTKGVFPQRY
jgi:microcystin-dependent protein